MKLYRVHLLIDSGASGGYEWFASKREADKLKREHDRKNGPEDSAEIQIIEVEPTRSGILRAFNIYGSHPNNG
jgi:hypothetical protein